MFTVTLTVNTADTLAFDGPPSTKFGCKGILRSEDIAETA